MRKILIISILSLIAFTSCRKDFSAALSSGNLIFSKDTVYLDTVFTNIGSSTYNLKVYNKSNHAISIPTIKLEKGENSFYRLNVDGIPGKQFQNVEILAKDSMYIFIETTIDVNQVTNPIYTDAIVFDSGDNLQDVKLVTLVQDANFLYPSKDLNGLIETIKIGIDADGNELKVNGFYLNDNTTFTNEKPYVIYGYCAVPNGKTLTVDAGAKIHFHSNSGLIIDKNATLIMNGELDNTITVEGDRLEPEFSNVPGQWGTIWLRAGSKNNMINNTIIKNASAGIIIDSIGNTSPTLTIKNTQIYNNTNFGILGRETNIYGENLVINNSGQSSLACTVGGTYNFVHSTFANFWNQSLRQFPSVLVNNYFTYIKDGAEVIEPRNLQAANFTNCIIDGNNNIEFILDKAEGADFNYSFKNNVLRFDDFNNSYAAITEYNFEDTNFYTNNILNGISDFKNPNNNELIIGENSDGIQKAETQGSLNVPFDILGISRTLPADIGAYQHITFN
ncbi:hypothetical protein [Lutibacter sp.]|uniref:hypothetical protein n=1 Tax=Lutibacter sp. TaxID=1925666 RepID=UPI0025C4CCC3|nr:hypothetical protein [Lutibacter sp.]MCF6182574.1 hypothetical protein [Lutibacter sp.]